MPPPSPDETPQHLYFSTPPVGKAHWPLHSALLESKTYIPSQDIRTYNSKYPLTDKSKDEGKTSLMMVRKGRINVRFLGILKMLQLGPI